MNALAAAALAAGELICEFSDGDRKSLLAFEAMRADSAQVLSTRRPGRRSVAVYPTDDHLHFVEPDGASVRVTTLTACTRTRWRFGGEECTRFDARHAWHFDTSAHIDADGSFRRQPSGGATGSCEPWKLAP